MKRNFIRLAAAASLAGSLALAGAGVSGAVKAHAIPTYTIVYQGPLTGGNAQLGLNMKYAVQLAINNFNAVKGNMFKLAFAAKDDQGDPSVAPSVAQGVVADSSVIGVVGPAFSGATAASEAFYDPAKLPIISPSATRVSLATNGWSTFHRVVADDGIQGPADADYAVMKLKAKAIYVVDDASSYGSGLASAFAGQAKKDGASVTAATVPGTTQCQGGSGDSSEYAAAAAAVKASKATMLFYGGYYCDLGLFTGALHTAGFTGTIFSGDGSLDPHYISGTTPASATNGALLSCACATVTNTAFVQGFTALAKFAPGTYSAEAFDAANAMIAAIKSVKTVTRANVNAALNAKGFMYKGLTKTIAFTSTGNISGSAIYVNKVVCKANSCSIVQQGLE